MLSLALGLGASTAVVCWLQHFVLRPLPGVADQSRLVVFVSNQGSGNISLPDLADLDRLESVFAGTFASQFSAVAFSVDREIEWVETQVVSARFFDVLGIRPILGRTFHPDEDRQPGGNPVLVIGENFWRRRFAADPAIVGRTVELNRHTFTIVGVVPAAFRGTMTPSSFDAWAPLSMVAEVRNNTNQSARNARGWHNLARLQPGVTLAQAQAAVDALDAELARQFPATNREVHHRVVPLSECPWGAQTLMGPTLRLLLVVSLGVLLIVAANVANLLLARAAARQKEIAIRLATGASRARIVRQFLTESLLLALLGGALGVLLASWLVDTIPLFIPPSLAARVHLEFPLDGSTLALALLLTLAIGLLFGTAPALQASRQNLQDALKAGGRSSSGAAAHHRLRHGLVVAEIALALVLLVGAGLCLKGFQQARRVSFGFNPDRVLVAGLQIGMHGYDQHTGQIFYRQLHQRLSTLPGVEEAALASWFPLGLQGCKGSGVQVDGYVRPPGENPTYEYAIVSPRYFATLQVPLVAGRDFTDADDAAAPVAIVNEHFAQRFWPGRDAVGQKFRAFGVWRTVVGVARAGKYNHLNEPPSCFYYLPYRSGVPDLDLSLCVRLAAPASGESDPAAFTDTLRRAVHALDPSVEFVNAFALADYTQAVLVAERITAALLVLLGLVALVLAAMGVYAVMAYAVSLRTHEFGVRIALGARPRDVLWQVIRRGAGLAALGTAIGLVLALAVTRLLERFLYGVSPFDPLTFLAVAALLAATVLLACYFPARRATRVDPMIALRAE